VRSLERRTEPRPSNQWGSDMSIDVTDASFETDVIERSKQAAVVIDLWAPWCGPCVQLGPLLEKVVDETLGQVVLVKVNVDENPGIAQAFRVQSIPAVFAVKDGGVVDGFVGAQGEAAVREFVNKLLPSETERQLEGLLEAGDETALRQLLEVDPGHVEAIEKLAALLIERHDNDEALQLMARIPETVETRRLAALARSGEQLGPDVEAQLDDLLDRVKTDDEARQAYVDILEMLGAEDPRTAIYRRKLTSRLY
jgi:putative thioredoxin